MPSIAQQVLLRRLQRSGDIERIIDDVQTLTQMRPHYCEDMTTSGNQTAELSVPLHVGTINVGCLVIREKLNPRHREALKRWIASLFQQTANRMLHHNHSTEHEVLPGSIGKAARILQKNYQEDISLTSVAKQVNLSRERLSRLFHESLGLTFSDYLNMVRLERSRYYLQHTTDKIADIAFASGYQSVSQFNRRFKSAEGISPREYRQRTKQNTAQDLSYVE